jgi:preprotein translocase subunit SecE
MEFAPKARWLQFREFVRETRAEMKKVSWPGRQEVIGTTTVVLVLVILIGIYLWICDMAFYQAIDMIFTGLGARS